jgi:hypothetical protein
MDMLTPWCGVSGHTASMSHTLMRGQVRAVCFVCVSRVLICVLACVLVVC